MCKGPKHERQLDGSPLEAVDCGPASTATILSWASCREVMVETEGIRERMTPGPASDPDTTTVWDMARAIESYNGRMVRRGYSRMVAEPQRASVGGVADALKAGHMVGAVIDYDTINELLPNKSGSRTFRGLHMTALKAWRENKRGKNVTVSLDPLYDGRFPYVPRGRQQVKWSIVRRAMVDASESIEGHRKGLAYFCVVKRSVKVSEPDPGVDPIPPPPDEPDREEELEAALLDARSAFFAIIEEAQEQIEDIDELLPGSTSTSEPTSGARGNE